MRDPRPRAVALALVLVLLAACASAPQTTQLRMASPRLVPAVELDDTPFFPQERYQCGPAALATALAAGGASVTPDALTSLVFLPEREGSLQLELVAATRRMGFLPYVLAPSFADLLTEVQAGHPVIVLQNLALSWYPRWHYAVVVGFDLHSREIILRSGTQRRHVMGFERFERTWARSRYWAMVALSPDHLPVTANEPNYLKAIANLESLGQPGAAHAAYAAALARWPDSTLAWMGFGNTAYAINRHIAAEAAFQRVLEIDPAYTPALNNLAQLLGERGALAEAETLAQRAVDLDAGRSPVYAQTLAEIRARKSHLPSGVPAAASSSQ